MSVIVHDPTRCALGEGALWHPDRGALYWFDILRGRLLTRSGDETRTWQFGEMVSAAGWVDRDRLLIASETRLLLFDLESGAKETLAPLDADTPLTRSNDGRADPWGGFWIGTMGKRAEAGAGAIWRYYRGEVRKLRAGVTIPNAICFAPDGAHAHFTDTTTGVVLRQRLAARDGWPEGEPEPWLDLRGEGLNPDGAVCDAAGNFWNAQWGARRVACYDARGRFLRAVGFPADHTSCPAFGGPDLRTLFCTTALENLGPDQRDLPSQGMTFAAPDIATGQAEHRVIP